MMKKKRKKIEEEIWEVFTCEAGEQCWCRGVRCMLNKRKVFIEVAWITKRQAELIVKIHNEWLELKSI